MEHSNFALNGEWWQWGQFRFTENRFSFGPEWGAPILQSKPMHSLELLVNDFPPFSNQFSWISRLIIAQEPIPFWLKTKNKSTLQMKVQFVSSGVARRKWGRVVLSCCLRNFTIFEISVHSKLEAFIYSNEVLIKWKQCDGASVGAKFDGNLLS